MEGPVRVQPFSSRTEPPQNHNPAHSRKCGQRQRGDLLRRRFGYARVVFLCRFSAALAVACIALGCAEEVAPQAELLQGAPASWRLEFREFDYRQQEEESVAFALHAGEFVWRKRHFGVFSVAPFREIAMKDARLSMRFSSDEATLREKRVTDWDSLMEFGTVTRMTADPLVVEITDDAGVLLRLRADRASIASWRLDIDLRTNVTVTSRSGQRIEARRARWRGRHLAIRGPYTLTAGDVTETGVDARFTLEASGRLRSAAAPATAARSNEIY